MFLTQSLPSHSSPNSHIIPCGVSQLAACTVGDGYMEHFVIQLDVRCHARCGQVCLIVCTSLGHITCDAIAVFHGMQKFYAFGANF